VIGVEDLSVKGMARNPHLAKSVADAGLGECGCLSARLTGAADDCTRLAGSSAARGAAPTAALWDRALD